MFIQTPATERLAAIFLGCQLIVGCHGVSVVYVKDKITHSHYMAQLKQCYTDARSGVPLANHPTYGAGNMSPGVAFGVGALGGIAEGYMRAKRESEYAQACMKNQGYKRVDLNPKDRESYNSSDSSKTKTQILQRINRQVDEGIYVVKTEPTKEEEPNNQP